ncbi:MAG: hypothetical protein R2769_06205 [Saprospiraceae bacterium]
MTLELTAGRIQPFTPCNSRKDTLTCKAQDCPNIDVQIFGPRYYCNGFSYQNTPYTFIANGSDSTGFGTWNGDLIDQNGIFYVNQLNSEDYINLEFEEHGCKFFRTVLIQDITVFPPDFDVDSISCIGDTVSLTYSGDPAWYDFLDWQIVGSRIPNFRGFGPFNLTFDSAGTYKVRGFGYFGGCPAFGFNEKTIQILPKLQSPSILCNGSNPGTVLFEWNNVPGAVDYEVNVLSGQSGILSGNFYEISGLTAGDSVTIELIAKSPNGCDADPIVQTCVNNGCPPVALSIDAIAGFCEGSQNSINLTANINPQGTGTLTWTGQNVDQLAF